MIQQMPSAISHQPAQPQVDFLFWKGRDCLLRLPNSMFSFNFHLKKKSKQKAKSRILNRRHSDKNKTPLRHKYLVKHAVDKRHS